jgi:hypothetical protein
VNRELAMYESCPSFKSCVCNDCPLDPLAAIHGGPRMAIDGEEECKATKASRERIARAHGLLASWSWLPRELEAEARRSRWEKLADTERKRRAASLNRGRAQTASETHLKVVSDGLPAPASVGLGVSSPPNPLDHQRPSEQPSVASGCAKYWRAA